MSRRSKKRKVLNKRRNELWGQYRDSYIKWMSRKPAWWRILTRLKWKLECPYRPTWIDEHEELWQEYGWRNYFRSW